MLMSALSACLPGGQSIARANTERLDWIIVRENSEGDIPGMVVVRIADCRTKLQPRPAIFTRSGIERIMRFAFALARSRRRTSDGYHEIQCAEVWSGIMGRSRSRGRKGISDVNVDKWLVDAITTRMVRAPHTLDTIVATNLHADIRVILARRSPAV